MWGSMFGQTTAVTAPAPQPSTTFQPPPRGGLAGGEFREVSNTPLPSNMSVLPPDQKVARIAEKVRALETASMKNAWAKVDEEFKVQLLVWESRSRVMGKRWQEGVLRETQNRWQQALTAKTSIALDRALAMEPKGGDMLSNPMKNAVENVGKQERANSPRQQLAERLAVASVPATLPREENDKREVEDIVVASCLQDAKLERQIRKTLLLPVPPEMSAPGGNKNATLLGSAGMDAAFSAKLSSSIAMGAVSVAKMSNTSGLPAGHHKRSSSKTPSSLGMNAVSVGKVGSSMGMSYKTKENTTDNSQVGAPVTDAKTGSLRSNSSTGARAQKPKSSSTRQAASVERKPIIKGSL